MNEKRKSHKVRGIIIAALIFVIAVIVSLTDFITDLLWFGELGYVSVFLTEIKSKLMLGIPSFIILSFLAYLFLSILKSKFLKKNKFELEGNNRKRIRIVALAMSLVFGLILSITTVENLWFEILKFFNAQSFDVTDPLFGKDIGFYVFKLEFLEEVSNIFVQISIWLLILTFVFYLLLLSMSNVKREDPFTQSSDGVEFDYDDQSNQSGSSFGKFNFRGFDDIKNNVNANFERGSFKPKLKALMNVASTEVMTIGILFFIAVALRFGLMQYDLLYGGAGVCYGAGYTDVAVTLTIYRIIIILSGISAAMLIVAVKRKKFLLAVIAPVLMVALLFIQGPAAGLVQNLIVSPDEINKEREYIGYNIKYTRLAYDLTDISVKDFDPQNDLTKVDVLNNMETFSNIRINDFEPTEQFYNQTQSIRSYYTFNDVDVDRYYVNGEYTQVFLAAREIDEQKIEDSWLIRHLKYTHGYGITLSRVDKVTTSGQPDMLIGSIPPVSEVPEIQITRPEIYYGESTNDYVIIGSSEQEFDYPSGETNVYCSYEGEGGIPLTLFNKALFSIREGSLKMLVSSNINGNSRIMINRDIMQRAKKIAPFLLYDNNPLLVVSDSGQLYWIVDAYTASEYYPYSEPFSKDGDTNYIRNSVKIVIDAYNGTTNFYIADDSDPIVKNLAAIYPSLFKSLDEMPSDIRAHIQYPNALLDIQASVYMKYHMTDEEVFYQSEDLWAVANEFYGQSETKLSPINFIMKLPGESEAEFISSIPYTPNGKSNMTGLLIARSDGANYGQLVLYRLPKDRIIYGPAQIEAQINQDAEISKEFSLWNNSGATYSRGNMFVFPVEDSLLYVEPIYMEASSSSLPEVKRVIMYYGDKLAYENTLEECLNTLFGEGAGTPLSSVSPIDVGHEMAAAIENGTFEVIVPEDPAVDEETTDVVPTDKSQLKELIQQTTDLLNKLNQYLNSLE